MTIAHVNLPHIRNLINQGQAGIVDATKNEEFSIYIENNFEFIPVTGYSINWDLVPLSIQIRWDQSTDEQVKAFIKKTTLSKYAKVAIWYSPSQPGLVCDFEFAIENLDTLFLTGWGARYMYGVKFTPQIHFTFEDFIEVDSNKWISGIAIKELS